MAINSLIPARFILTNMSRSLKEGTLHDFMYFPPNNLSLAFLNLLSFTTVEKGPSEAWKETYVEITFVSRECRLYWKCSNSLAKCGH